jgi:SET domain-containing protein
LEHTNKDKDKARMTNVQMITNFIEDIIKEMGDCKITDKIRLTTKFMKKFEKQGITPINPKLISVRPSTRHGLGLFANEPIKEGNIIAFYPADFVIHNLNGDREALLIGENAELYNSEYDITLKNENYRISGIPTEYTQLFCGHLANDSASTETIEKLSVDFRDLELDDYGKRVSTYFIETKRNMNVKFKTTNHYVYLYATKDIEPNEELLTSYGFCYWGSDTFSTQKIKKYFQYLKTLTEKQEKVFIDLIYDYVK